MDPDKQDKADKPLTKPVEEIQNEDFFQDIISDEIQKEFKEEEMGYLTQLGIDLLRTDYQKITNKTLVDAYVNIRYPEELPAIESDSWAAQQISTSITKLESMRKEDSTTQINIKAALQNGGYI